MRSFTKILASLLVIGVVAGSAHAGVIMQWVPAADPDGDTPVGYLSWDLMATTTTNLTTQEMAVSTGVLGDIYQNAGGSTYIEPDPADFASDPALAFDTYVTLGAWGHPTPTNVLSGAWDITGSILVTFNTQNLDILWGPFPGSNSSPGTFQVARVTLKDTADGTWQFMGWQSGSIDAELFEGPIVNGVPVPEPATLGLLLLGGLALLRRRGRA